MAIFGFAHGPTRIELLKGSHCFWFLHGAPTEAVYNRLGRGANDITYILRGGITNSTNVVIFKMLPNVQKNSIDSNKFIQVSNNIKFFI